MGFWSTLGKIAGIAAPVVAAPFTGGTSLLGLGATGSKALSGALGAAGAASSVLGKQQEGAAAGRKSEAELLNDRDRTAVSLYGTRQGAENAAAQTDLDRKRYGDDARGSNANRAVIAALLGGGQMGSSISVPGVTNAKVSGGPLAALQNNPDALAALRELGSQSSGLLSSPAPFMGGAMLDAPTLSTLPKQSGGSSLLDTIARIGQVAGSVSPFLPQPKRKPEDPDPTGGLGASQNSVFDNVRF